MIFIIYKHTNSINKCYVGFTKCTIESRWLGHCKAAKSGSKAAFHRAIRKYGTENWTHEILEECSSLEEAFKREIYWIAFYKSNNQKYGYNMTAGGDGFLKHAPWNKGLTKETDERIKKIAKKYSIYASSKKSHLRKRRGNKHPLFGKAPWNKGLTKETDEKFNKLCKKISITRIKRGLAKGNKNPFSHKRRRIFNDNLKLNKLVKIEELQKYLDAGWKIGQRKFLF